MQSIRTQLHLVLGSHCHLCRYFLHWCLDEGRKLCEYGWQLLQFCRRVFLLFLRQDGGGFVVCVRDRFKIWVSFRKLFKINFRRINSECILWLMGFANSSYFWLICAMLFNLEFPLFVQYSIYELLFFYLDRKLNNLSIYL